MTWRYRVFGLDVDAPREIPTLRSARIAPVGEADVRVVFAPVPSPAIQETVNDDLGVSCTGTDLILCVEEVGRFLIRNGDTIVADVDPAADRPQVDLYLAGSVMGALLHQRAILPLHCNAVCFGDKAVLICGDSGAGKSTLAAWFEARGYPLLTDDVCAVTFPFEGSATGWPGMPRLRLWSDAVRAMERTDQASCAIPWADGKFELEMRSNRAANSLPIAAVYHLAEAETTSDFGIIPLCGLAAVDAITSSIYRRRLGDLTGRTAGYLKDAVRLAEDTPVYRIERTWGLEHLFQQSLEIERHARLVCGVMDENTFTKYKHTLQPFEHIHADDTR